MKRFISKDPAGIDPAEPRTINRYTFVHNNPLRFYDPDGRISLEGMFKWIFKFDTGTTVEEGIEQPLANAGVNVSDKFIEHSALYKFEKVLLTELTPAGDIYRIGLGVDPYTHQLLTNGERLSELSQTATTFGIGKLLKLSKLTKLHQTFDIADKGYKIGAGLNKEF